MADVDTVPPRPYLREEVYQRLREYVATLAEAGGEPKALREADLARSLGVSRTPVREALNRLQQEGIVQVQPHRGAKVLPTSMEDYLCWLEIREVLEGVAARRAAERMSAAEVRELRALFKPFAKRPSKLEENPLPFFKANAEFHSRIIAASGAPLLERLGSAYDYMGSGRQRARARSGRLAQAIAEHHAIIDALEKQDGARAERLSREHVRGLRLAVAARAAEAPTSSAGPRSTR